MQQAPGRTDLGQPDRQPGGIGHGGASVERKTLNLRWKAQTHLSPDGIDRTPRLRKLNRGWIAGRDEALLPHIDPAALVVPISGHDSKKLPASATGRLRLT